MANDGKEGETSPNANPDAKTEGGGEKAGWEEIITQLEAQVHKLEKEKKDMHDLLLRTAADFENFKKRSRKEVEEGMNKGREGVWKELLPVLDNLERALKHASATDALAQGVRMVEKQLLAALEKFGVTRFSTAGQPFDPALHDAIQQIETAEIAPNHVAQEYAAGYLSQGKLLRPAMVAVSKAPGGEGAPPAGEGG